LEDEYYAIYGVRIEIHSSLLPLGLEK